MIHDLQEVLLIHLMCVRWWKNVSTPKSKYFSKCLETMLINCRRTLGNTFLLSRVPECWNRLPSYSKGVWTVPGNWPLVAPLDQGLGLGAPQRSLPTSTTLWLYEVLQIFFHWCTAENPLWNCKFKQHLNKNYGSIIKSSLFFFAETRTDRTKKLFRHYTVGSYDSFDASRWEFFYLVAICWQNLCGFY